MTLRKLPLSFLSQQEVPIDRKDQSFPKRVRLRTRKQFLRTQREGMRYMSDSFFAHIRASRQGMIKLGITASKKVGKAHDRNRYKRLTREAFRLSRLRHLKGYDVALVIKQENPPTQLSELMNELNRLAHCLETGELKLPKKRNAHPTPRGQSSRTPRDRSKHMLPAKKTQEIR